LFAIKDRLLYSYFQTAGYFETAVTEALSWWGNDRGRLLTWEITHTHTHTHTSHAAVKTCSIRETE